MSLRFNPLVFGGLDYYQTASGGKEYKAKAAGGLELGGAETNEFAVKSEGVTEAMLSAAVIGKFHTYTAGEGLELSGSEFKVKAEGIVNALVKKETLEPNRLEKEKLESAQVKEHGLLVNRLKEGEINNAYIKTAAGIEESKLSLPEVIKKTTEQNISAPKTFNNTASSTAPIRVFNETFSTTGTNVTGISLPWAMTLTAEGAGIRALASEGTVTWEKKSAARMMQLFANATKLTNIGNIAMGQAITLRASPQLKPAAETTTTGWHPIAVEALAEAIAAAESTATAIASTGLLAGLVTGTGWTFPIHRAVLMKNATGAGTVEKQIALHVENLTKGTTNYSVFSEGAEVKLKNEGPMELGVGFGVWKTTPPAAQHAAIPEPALELGAERVAINEIREVLKEYGMTK